MTTPFRDHTTSGVASTRRRRALGAAWRTYRHNRPAMVGLVTVVVFGLLAVFGSLLLDARQLDVSSATGPVLAHPSGSYLLGTDNFGRSVLALVVSGARVSLLVGLTATIGAMVIGAAIGVAAGYFGGTWVDTALTSVINWFLAIPWVVFAIALAAILGPTLLNIIVVIAITSWPTTALVVRAQVLTVRERTYVERARALGGGHWHVVTRHVLPNVAPLILANATLTVGLAILAETTLSILGLGDPGSISWGRVIEEAFTNGAVSSGYWWWLMPPGLAIVAVTLAFTMCGYGLEEVLDPKLRR